MSTYIAVEFDLARGELTGRQMEFGADDLSEAARKLVYTLNLSSAGWKVSPSGRTVGRMTGDIGWHLVKAGSPAARNMGATLRDSRRATWTRSNTRVDTWFERDRAHVDLQTLSGDTIIEWRDEEVEEAVQDGFLSPRDWHGSAVEYANHIGAKPRRAPRRKTRR